MDAFSLFLPMSLHLLWCVFLYAFLTLARAPNVWAFGKDSRWGVYLLSIEGRISANLNNQFQWPLFFYVICLFQLSANIPFGSAFVGLAWLFVFGRIIHSLVQIFTANVRLRGIVFTVNFVAVLLLWCLALFDFLVVAGD